MRSSYLAASEEQSWSCGSRGSEAWSSAAPCALRSDRKKDVSVRAPAGPHTCPACRGAQITLLLWSPTHRPAHECRAHILFHCMSHCQVAHAKDEVCRNTSPPPPANCWQETSRLSARVHDAVQWRKKLQQESPDRAGRRGPAGSQHPQSPAHRL